MHEFENSWLFQREKIDNISKNKLIIKKINRYFKSDQNIKLMDLGTGTGSNFRFLSKKIVQKKQHWTLIDISKKSLLAAKNKISISNKIESLSIINKNLIKNINQVDFNEFDIVTGSAFLDIMPLDWFKKFYQQNKKTKIIYFAINYDGFFQFYPKHKHDKKVLHLFNNDQKSIKYKKVKAVGPDCTKIIEKQFLKTHKTFSFNSNWDINNNKKFQLMFLNFCENVINKNKINNLNEWLEYRKNQIKKNESRLIVNNKDFLAIKI